MSRRPLKKYTEAELNYLRENGSKMKPKEIAEVLDRPYSSIVLKLHELGVEWPHDENSTGRKVGLETWRGCDKTCPDFCPYSDCVMPLRDAAIGIEKDFILNELFYKQGAKS